MSEEPTAVRPYSVLAAGYDLVMAHVDYESWAEYIHYLIGEFAEYEGEPAVLELGCGTGTMALALFDMGYQELRGTDRSPEMIEVAQRKAAEADAEVSFEVEDFTSPRSDATFDVILLLYDGLNYILDAGGVRELFTATRDRLKTGGIFLFDQSTPANSINNEPYFEDEGGEGEFRYERRSRYEPETGRHTTTLDLFVGDKCFRESHEQQAYTRDEIRVLIEESNLEILAAYEGFSLDEAGHDAERIHWVVRRADD
jgi:SAM-dependent methyltransferase